MDPGHQGQGSSGPDETANDKGAGIALPAHVDRSGTFGRLVDTARDGPCAAAAENALKAYAKDWAHFIRWCRMKGAEPLPPPLPSRLRR